MNESFALVQTLLLRLGRARLWSDKWLAFEFRLTSTASGSSTSGTGKQFEDIE
jgi:hypothetical protein